MGRKASRPQQAGNHDQAQDSPAPESDPAETNAAAAPVSEIPMSKSEAARQALAAGLERPEEATDFIRRQFGIEMSKPHFSAVKAQVKKKQSAGGREPRKGKPIQPPEATPQLPPAAPPSSGHAPDLIDSLETLKPLIAQYGPEKVKRLVDLLG